MGKILSSERCISIKYKINVIISANGILRVSAIWLKTSIADSVLEDLLESISRMKIMEICFKGHLQYLIWLTSIEWRFLFVFSFISNNQKQYILNINILHKLYIIFYNNIHFYSTIAKYKWLWPLKMKFKHRMQL